MATEVSDWHLSALDTMTSPLTDENLVESTLGGDEDAFSHLYERYRRPVYSTVFRVIQNVEEAQDATQEVFVKLYRSLHNWDPEKAKFSTWLYRLAANHAIDCWRTRRRRAESQLPGEAPERLFSESPLRYAIRSPYREAEAREQVQEIRRCVDALPDLQKKVFILRYFQELKLEEIADVEDCSLGTVKTSLFRATHAVRRALREARRAT
jgi:RNA polymerase sigma-70 factor (ECF subfamily)